MKTGMVSAIPDRPGSMIDPGFVSYTGTVSEAISMESAERTIVTSRTFCNWTGFTSGANGNQFAAFD